MSYFAFLCVHVQLIFVVSDNVEIARHLSMLAYLDNKQLSVYRNMKVEHSCLMISVVNRIPHTSKTTKTHYFSVAFDVH